MGVGRVITFGLPPLTLDSIEAAKAKNPKAPVKPAKKSRKLPGTPRSRVRSALRALWLRSREHQACLKAASRACERCGVKASVAKGREVKLQVHHTRGIANWEAVIDLVFAELLVDPRFLEAICVQCHKVEHKPEKE
jgi:hypothetical protein